MAEKRIPTGGPRDPGPEGRFEAPELTELSTLFIGGIGTRAEQQQQQQQQQQSRRRFLNLETQLPEEEVVSKLVTEVRQINKLAPRADQ